jgi:hypothetical protein
MVGSDDSLAKLQLGIPLRKPRITTGSHAGVKLLQYAPDLSTIPINLGSLPTKRS